MRFRPRFSVRTLAIFVTLVCAYFGAWEGSGHVLWSHLPVEVGDEFTLRVVEVEPQVCQKP